MDQPRTGHESIRETVNRFGMVYIFSRKGGIAAEPLVFLSDHLTQEVERALVTAVKTFLCLTLSWNEPACREDRIIGRHEAKVRLRRGRARKLQCKVEYITLEKAKLGRDRNGNRGPSRTGARVVLVKSVLQPNTRSNIFIGTYGSVARSYI